MILHHWLCQLIWHGVVASCKKYFSYLLIAVCLSWPICLVCSSASHREIVHTPVIHHLQRLVLDVVCYDCHRYLCMQANCYTGVYVSVRCSSHWGGSLQNGLRDEQTCGMTLALAYMLHCLSAMWSQVQMIGRSPRWEWVLIWYVAIEYQRSSSIRIIFIDYQTSKLQCNY